MKAKMYHGGIICLLSVIISLLQRCAYADEGECLPRLDGYGSFSSVAGGHGRIHNLEDTILKNRPFLVDSTEDYFPERLNSTVDDDFPKIFVMDPAALHNGESIGAMAKRMLDVELQKYGAIVLRGLPLKKSNDATKTPENAIQFSEFLASSGFNLTKYIGGVTIRPEVEPMVYPASEEDPKVCMDLHQDNCYWPTPPQKLFFYYEEPAKVGGLNPLLNMRSFITSLYEEAPGIVRSFESLGVRYEFFYPDASKDARFSTWQSAFPGSDKNGVTEILQAQEADGVGFEWTTTGGLRKWRTQSPFQIHPQTQEKLWVNMICANHASYFHAHPSFPELNGVSYSDAPEANAVLKGHLGFEDYPFHVRFGDGSSIPYTSIQKLRELAWNSAGVFQPLTGDVLVMDNYLTQHARLGYAGPRKLWLGISLS